MKRIGCGLAALLLVACRGGSQSAAKSDPQFDQVWHDLTRRGAEPAYIESDGSGKGLLGEVRRAAEPVLDGALIRGGAAPLPGPLPDGEAARVVRQNLSAIKACYDLEQRSGTASSGKAILTIEIDPTGNVNQVHVDAPTFRASHLPECVSGRARSWVFPKFTRGPKTFSYPLIFIGS